MRYLVRSDWTFDITTTMRSNAASSHDSMVSTSLRTYTSFSGSGWLQVCLFQVRGISMSSPSTSKLLLCGSNLRQSIPSHSGSVRPRRAYHSGPCFSFICLAANVQKTKVTVSEPHSPPTTARQHRNVAKQQAANPIPAFLPVASSGGGEPSAGRSPVLRSVVFWIQSALAYKRRCRS